MRAISATTSSGDLRRFARLCARLADRRQQHQVGAAFDRALRAFQIRHEHRHAKSGQRLGERDQLIGVGQLRQQARGDE